MDAVKFLEEYNRMCNTYNDCVGCPMHDKPFCHPHDITTNSERKNLVSVVEKWSCEHSMVANDASDTVSRAAAIDVIDRAVTKEAARWALQELPSADRPTGEWIGEADGYADGEFVYDTWYCSNYDTWYCSNCDYVVDDEEPPTWNFCPNCGSYNGGGQSEND